MTQPHSTSCPDCGAPLPADSPQSLCPACLLKQAMASRTIVPGQDGTPPPPPPAPEEIADKFPQFEVTECLGSGGMGVVYKARQKSLDRWVAIKILRPEKTGDERFAERFAREAQTLARLNHPNIVTVFDYGETSGLFYIVMEFVDGVNLRDLLREGKLEPEQALAIVPPICEALQYAHEKGIVHRDIKPENLLLDRDGRLKIADFGIASIIGAGGEASGTPPYMAPEQQRPSKVDHRADIYALGVVLYEMLTGERPGKDLVSPSRKAHTDVRLDEMVMRAMEQDPARRYQTASEFRTMVETIQPEATPPPFAPAVSSPPVQVQGMWSRFWWLLPVLVPIGILLGLGGGILQEYLAPKKYQSQAIVQVMSSGHAMGGGTLSGGMSVKLGQLTSPSSLQEVGRRLNLEQRWQLDPEMIEFKMRGMTEVQVIPGTSLVAIRVTSHDRTEAAEIANMLGEVFGTKASTNAHETAVPANAPLRPTLLLVLAKSSLIGLLIALLAAFPVMLLAHRRYLRKNGIPTRSRALKVIAVCLLCLGWLVYGKPRMLDSSHRGAEGPVLGRVKVDFTHPQQFSGGFGLGFPAMQGTATPWRPNKDGQQLTLKEGRTGRGRARVVSHGAGSPVLVVSTTVDGLHWETQEAVLDLWPTGDKFNLNFTNGFKSQVSWMPAEEPLEGPRQGTSWFSVIVGIFLLGIIALVLLIVAIARAKSGTGKTVGIIAVVLLILGMLGALPLLWMVSARPRAIPLEMGPRQAIEAIPERN